MCAGVIVTAGVTIEDDVIVGANSTVTKNLVGGYLYAGSPAKKIRKLKSAFEDKRWIIKF